MLGENTEIMQDRTNNQQFYTRRGTVILRKNPFSVGSKDLYYSVGEIPSGTKVTVKRFFSENIGFGYKRFAELSNGDVVDADMLVSYSFLPDDERASAHVPEKKISFWAWAIVIGTGLALTYSTVKR